MPVFSSAHPPGDCGCTAEAPVLLRPPADILLVLDRSGSMTADRLSCMKQGALNVTERLCRGGSRMGLVTFSGSACAVVPLTRSAEAMKRGIRAIRAHGATNHSSALHCARNLLPDCTDRRKVVLLFTDGVHNGACDPAAEACALRKSGAELFCIGLGPELPPLEQWASSPEHVFRTDCPARLPDLFSAFVTRLCRKSAPDHCCCLPSQWTRCNCHVCRPVPPEQRDDASFLLGRCQDTAEVDLPPACLSGLGRVVYLNVTLKHICPNKRLAVAVLLRQVDCCGKEHSCGMRCFTVPAQGGTVCRDVELHCIRFVIPEDLCCSGSFRAQVMANYLDTDVTCCDGAASL